MRYSCIKKLCICVLVSFYSCKKSIPEQPSPIESKVEMTDLCASYWRVFIASVIESQKFKRTDTTGWNRYVNYKSTKANYVIYFKADGIYECDSEIANALLIPLSGKYIPIIKGQFDTILFTSSYRSQKVAVRKYNYSNTPDKYEIDLKAQGSDSYFQGVGHVRLELIN